MAEITFRRTDALHELAGADAHFHLVLLGPNPPAGSSTCAYSKPKPGRDPTCCGSRSISRLAGYEDVNDAARLSQDPTFRLIGSEKVLECGAPLTSRLQSFETELLTQTENLAGLAALNRELVAKGEAINSPRRVVLDMDSTEIPVYGRQEQGPMLTTATSSPPGITRCCCSTARAIAWR